MIRNRKISITFCLILCAILVLVSCNKPNTNSADDTDNRDVDVSENAASYDADSTDSGDTFIAYEYPTNPVMHLKEFLEKDITERGLPMEVSGVAQVIRNGYEYKEFTIRFTDGNENVCVVSFTQSFVEFFYHRYDDSLNGENNPSFSIAFKNPDRPQDMVAVLTSVFLYLSPDLGVVVAERLATKQDDTISIDGFSIPQDMGSYQVQSHYTYPHTRFTTEDFSSSFGVTVTALEQLWGADLDFSLCKKLSSGEDFKILNEVPSMRNEGDDCQSVYADFIVNDWWQYQEPLHYEIVTWVAAETLNGKLYQFRLDTMRTPYEFGIGEKYTLFISRSNYGPVIFHAIQLSD